MAKEASEETGETDGGRQRTPLTMIVPPLVLTAAAAVLGLLPQLGTCRPGGGGAVPGPGGYNATVLSGARRRAPRRPGAAGGQPGSRAADLATGAGSAAGAVLLAGVALYWRRLPLLRRRLRARAPGCARPGLAGGSRAAWSTTT